MKEGLKGAARRAALPLVILLAIAAVVSQLQFFSRTSAQAGEAPSAVTAGGAVAAAPAAPAHLQPARGAGAERSAESTPAALPSEGTEGGWKNLTKADGLPETRGETVADAGAAAMAAARPVAAAASTPVPPIAGQEIRAQLSPRRFTTMATEIGARVQQVSVSEGGRFQGGQLLIALDCSIQRAQLDRSRAEMVATEKIVAANEQLDKFNSIGKLDLETSRAAHTKAQADVAVAQATLKKCEIRAPYDGRIAELRVREQQYVQPGQPLMEILDDSSLELDFIVPSRWLSWLRPGLPFTVSIDETGRSYTAKFTRIGAKVDPVSMSVRVAGEIAGNHPELMAGMSGVITAQPPRPARADARKRNGAER